MRSRYEIQPYSHKSAANQETGPEWLVAQQVPEGDAEKWREEPKRRKLICLVAPQHGHPDDETESRYQESLKGQPSQRLGVESVGAKPLTPAAVRQEQRHRQGYLPEQEVVRPHAGADQ